MAPDGDTGAFADLIGPVGASPITLYREDCLRGIPRHFPRGSIGVLVTSPPYNRGVGYGRYRDELPRDEYVAWLGRAGRVFATALAPDGSFFLNMGGSPSDPWLPWDVARAIGRSLVLQNVIHWVKSIAIDRGSAGKGAGVDRDLALGHYKPLNSERYLHGGHEYVFHFSHRGDVALDRLAIGVPYQDKTNVARWKGRRDVRCRGNTWFLPYPTIRFRAKDRPHPATFPVELAERCLKLHGVARVGRAVDPFLGIGSSAVAAARLGIPFTGFDIDDAYLTIARRRLTDEGAVPASVVAGATRTARPAASRGRRIK
ncbi:MAG: site-specific DNA-methyltransferase [Thermoplasmata archaeon]|nr:site-specific DNA-methyltransferase [Thermoplasmata archaeon]